MVVSFLPCVDSWRRRAGIPVDCLAVLTPCRRRLGEKEMFMLVKFCGL